MFPDDHALFDIAEVHYCLNYVLNYKECHQQWHWQQMPHDLRMAFRNAHEIFIEDNFTFWLLYV